MHIYAKQREWGWIHICKAKLPSHVYYCAAYLGWNSTSCCITIMQSASGRVSNKSAHLVFGGGALQCILFLVVMLLCLYSRDVYLRPHLRVFLWLLSDGSAQTTRNRTDISYLLKVGSPFPSIVNCHRLHWRPQCLLCWSSLACVDNETQSELWYERR